MATTMSANITQDKPVNSTPILPEIGEKTAGNFEKMDISTTNSRPPGGAELSLEEEVATSKFLENVNKWRAARELTEVGGVFKSEKVKLNFLISAFLVLGCEIFNG